MKLMYIFLDVDGTITNYHNYIPDSAKIAIKKARSNGHKVIFVTGRSKAEMYEEILEIGYDGYIGGNGSYIEYDEKVILEKVLSKEDTKAIVDWLHENGLEFYLESNNGLFASKNFEQRGKSTMQEYVAYKGQDNASEMNVRKSFPEMIFGEENLYREDLNKVSFILESYDDYLNAKEKFSHLKVGTWGGDGEKALFGDIGVANIDKGNAISQLLSQINGHPSNTIAFGDAKVDIPMFNFCHIGVALGSGGEEIKSVADYVTDTVDNDGIYKAFEHFKLI